MLDLTYLNRLTALVAILRERKKQLTRVGLLDAITWIELNNENNQKPIFGFAFTLTPHGPTPTELYISMIQDYEIYSQHLKVKECQNGVILVENLIGIEQLELSDGFVTQLKALSDRWLLSKQQDSKVQPFEDLTANKVNKLAV